MEKIPEQIHSSWHEHLQPLFDDKKMGLIKNQLLPKCKFYPEANMIFRVFSMPLDKIKVVVLGQDPYFNGSANGLAFAVNQRTPIPASLKIIKNEIINSYANAQTPEQGIDINSEKWKTLEHWEQQGVFLLNTALTVQVGVANSHSGQWQWFTREVVRIISSEVTPVWLLWGSKAKGYRDYIVSAEIFKVNSILEADHPAAETYPNSKYKFTGCNHFNLCNEILKGSGETIIYW